MTLKQKKKLMFQTTKSKILSEMSAFAGRGLLSDITFATNTYSRMHPSIQGTYCKMHSAFICQTIYVGREPLGGERKKNVQFILYINYLEEKSPKTCIWAPMPFYNIIKRIQKKKLGQRKPETAGAEDNYY
jgi:hypothetical protein